MCHEHLCVTACHRMNSAARHAQEPEKEAVKTCYSHSDRNITLDREIVSGVKGELISPCLLCRGGGEVGRERERGGEKG